MDFDDSSKEKGGRVDDVRLQQRMTHKLAIQQAMKAYAARKAISEHLLAYLDKE
jgi:hypothetical protein